ncbi:hypothetical protein HYZ97_04655 [Candidatus Pacearchaeota archaeon]|nr:hypothetical protein [Candidatus Pacearchaeota archaeon]
MKRIETADQKMHSDATTQRRVKWLGIFLLLIMVISSVGYAFISSPDSEEEIDTLSEEGVQEINGRWVAVWNGQELVFSSSPESVKEVPVSMNLTIEEYYQQTAYYAQNPGLHAELVQSLGLYSALQPACLGACIEDFPEKNCTDLVISWNRTGDNQVSQENKCIFIQGDLRAVDAFLYRLFDLL